MTAKSKFDQKILEIMQVGSLVGQGLLLQAKEFKENFNAEDYKKMFFEKAISLTDLTRMKLEELAKKNGVTVASTKVKKAGKKAKAEVHVADSESEN